MIVKRWQARIVPTKEQVKMIFLAEGLEPYEETYEPEQTIPEHRHPFNEIRMVVKGELFLNISGNQLLLRAGDRIEIPSNTKHKTTARGEEKCVCICAKSVFKGFSA